MRHRIQTTKPQQLIDITNKVADEVRNSNVQDGYRSLHVPINSWSHNK